MKYKILIPILLLYLFLSIQSAVQGGDFDVFLDAAQRLKDGQNIYAPPFLRGLNYYYSPLFALILIPFSSHVFITELLWLFLSGFWLYRTWTLVKNYFDFSIFNQKQILAISVISFFFIFRFLLYNISMIQITIFLLWGILESIELIKNKKIVWGAMLLAFIINVKLMPLIALPYLIYRGKFKASALVVIFSVVFLFLPALFIGSDYNHFLLTQWWQVINPSNSEHMIEVGVDSQSLVGMVPVFITETQGDFPYQRNLLQLSIENTELMTQLSRLFLVAFTIFFLKSPFKKNVSRLSEIRAISYILLVVPLIFPHQQKYAFLFVFPMVFYLTYYCFIMWKFHKTISFNWYLSLLILVGIAFSPIIGSSVIGRLAYDLFHHFRLLGISTLLLIVFAAFASPKRMEIFLSQYKH